MGTEYLSYITAPPRSSYLLTVNARHFEHALKYLCASLLRLVASITVACLLPGVLASSSILGTYILLSRSVHNVVLTPPTSSMAVTLAALAIHRAITAWGLGSILFVTLGVASLTPLVGLHISYEQYNAHFTRGEQRRLRRLCTWCPKISACFQRCIGTAFRTAAHSISVSIPLIPAAVAIFCILSIFYWPRRTVPLSARAEPPRPSREKFYISEWRVLRVPSLVPTSSCRTWSLRVHGSHCVRHVINGFCAAYGIVNSDGILLYRSKGGPLDETSTVCELGLDELTLLSLRVGLRGGARGSGQAPRNKTGVNQWGQGSILERFPELPQIIQGYLNNRKSQTRILELIQQDHPYIPAFKLRTLASIIKKCDLTTSRNPKLTPQQATEKVLQYVEHDSARGTGYRKVHKELKAREVHMPRDMVELVLREHEPEKVVARHPGAKKIHTSTLVRRGPNEEWSCDGHLKLGPEMGLVVWGIVDVFSRRVLHHFVVPDPINGDMVRALYLRVVEKQGGIPFQLTLDQGPETGQAAGIQIGLRKLYHPADVLEEPAYAGLKSVYNITVERQWKELFKEVLKNLLEKFKDGLNAGIYHPQNPTHQAIMQWVWARIVQAEVTAWVNGKNSDYIRKQTDSKLPSAGTRDDFYLNPSRWGGENCLVSIPSEVISDLKDKYSPDDLFHFGTPELEAFCDHVYNDILHRPVLSVVTGWPVVRDMIRLLPVEDPNLA